MKIISVTFFDETAQTTISSARMPLHRLPETFAVDTILAMNGAEYVVVSASPETKRDFAMSKQLQVILRRRPTTTPGRSQAC